MDGALCGLVIVLAAVVLVKEISVGGFRFGDAVFQRGDATELTPGNGSGMNSPGLPAVIAVESTGSTTDKIPGTDDDCGGLQAGVWLLDVPGAPSLLI